jgi:two-component system, LuxR family, response regulator FixJ
VSGPSARKVLIVDDDASVRKSLRRLVQAAGYDVELFAEAREYLARESEPTLPACLVVDVRMPGMSGLELVDLIAGTTRALPVVFITGYADDDVRARAEASGAVALLDKPVADTVLLEAIERGLERSLHR